MCTPCLVKKFADRGEVYPSGPSPTAHCWTCDREGPLDSMHSCKEPNKVCAECNDRLPEYPIDKLSHGFIKKTQTKRLQFAPLHN